MTTYTLTRRDTGACARVEVARTLGRTAYAIPCPWHADETASCAFSLQSHLFYCFGCGAYGLCREEPFEVPADLDAWLDTLPEEDLPVAEMDAIMVRIHQCPGDDPMSRWPIIRHVRWWYLNWRFNRWWLRVGRNHGVAPNPCDEVYLDYVWKGEA
jgi:CHC2 zinc finger